MRLVLGMLLVSLALATPANAEPFPPIGSDEANQHLTDGLTEYNLGNWNEAIRHFEAGERIEDSNKFFWNLAQAHRNAGNLEKARWHYERLIARLDGVEGAEEVTEWSRKYIAEIDGRPLAQPEPDPRPEVTSSLDGPAPSTFTTSRKIALVTGAAGVLLFGVAGGMALHAGDLRDDAAALCSMAECDRADDANALIERSDRNYRNAEISVAVGIGAVAVGAILWFTGKPEKRPRGALMVSPSLAPNSAGVDVLVRF